MGDESERAFAPEEVALACLARAPRVWPSSSSAPCPSGRASALLAAAEADMVGRAVPLPRGHSREHAMLPSAASSRRGEDK